MVATACPVAPDIGLFSTLPLVPCKLGGPGINDHESFIWIGVDFLAEGTGSFCEESCVVWEGGSNIDANGRAGIVGTVGKEGPLSSSAFGDNAERIFPMVLDIISSSSESEESKPLASMTGLGDWNGDSNEGLGELYDWGEPNPA